MSRRGWWIGLIGLLLALVGVWGVWVPHQAVALVLSGWDLAEFVKFLPGVAVVRECFYLPVLCVTVALGLMASQPVDRGISGRDSAGEGRRWQIARKVMLWLVALGLAVAILPPYPHLLNGYRSAEFRWRFILGFGGCLWVLVSVFNKRWPDRVIGGSLVGLALVGTIPALWQFLQVRDPIASIYGACVGWGWGIGALFLGWGLVGVVGARLLLSRQVRPGPGGSRA
jgi:hypothetical protein